MLKHLLSPFTLKGKTLRNRSVVSAMVTNYCNADGTCTERFTAYHEAKAKGGFGMIITEDFAVGPEGKGFPFLPGLWNDQQIPGFAAFTKRLHHEGAVVIAQIYHAGRQTNSAITHCAPSAPSAIPCPFSPDMPREMTEEDIRMVVAQFGECAHRAEQAGFDGVEIHAAHGYLISQFLSHYSNKRTDSYGGSLGNRMRLLLEIMADVRGKCSEGFILGLRISADEFVTGGRTIEDTKAIVPFLECAGADYIHCSAGVYRSFGSIIPTMYCHHGWAANMAAEVKKVTSLPVITVGRFNDPLLAESVLACGNADLVAMGRQSLCDPETINKAAQGRFSAIRQCIACHHGCVGNLLQGKPISCIFNPTLGREWELLPVKTDAPKKVMVIGAGPAGLQAAISAAQAGHKVTVYEKKRWAGGQFRLGAVPPSKGEIVNFITYQLQMLADLDVEVRHGCEVMPAMVQAENPDVIIAALGAEPSIPHIPGVDRDFVVTAHAVLAGEVNTGARVVVIGGGCVGAETANYLASNLKAVTVIEMQDSIATDEALVPRWELLDDMKKHQVTMRTSAVVKEIADGGVTMICAGQEEFITADTVVLAVGSRSVTALAEALKQAGHDVHCIGDCARVGLAGDAVEQGFMVGRTL